MQRVRYKSSKRLLHRKKIWQRMAIFHCKPYNTLLNCVNYQLFDNFFINKNRCAFFFICVYPV